jgi:hypothetical protein
MPLDLHKRSAGKAKARDVRIQALDVRSEMPLCRLIGCPLISPLQNELARSSSSAAASPRSLKCPKNLGGARFARSRLQGLRPFIAPWRPRSSWGYSGVGVPDHNAPPPPLRSRGFRPARGRIGKTIPIVPSGATGQRHSGAPSVCFVVCESHENHPFCPLGLGAASCVESLSECVHPHSRLFLFLEVSALNHCVFSSLQ